MVSYRIVQQIVPSVTAHMASDLRSSGAAISQPVGTPQATASPCRHISFRSFVAKELNFTYRATPVASASSASSAGRLRAKGRSQRHRTANYVSLRDEEDPRCRQRHCTGDQRPSLRALCGKSVDVADVVQRACSAVQYRADGYETGEVPEERPGVGSRGKRKQPTPYYRRHSSQRRDKLHGRSYQVATIRTPSLLGTCACARAPSMASRTGLISECSSETASPRADSS